MVNPKTNELPSNQINKPLLSSKSNKTSTRELREVPLTKTSIPVDKFYGPGDQLEFTQNQIGNCFC